MNYYPHHIGDYLTATAHLSWLEDCAYRRLLDVYYSREQAIPGEVSQACRLVRATAKDERRAVESVLREFFTLEGPGWTHKRCAEEIAKAAEAAERARTNGKRGGRPPKLKPTTNPPGYESVNPEETHPVISGNPEKSNSQAPNPNPNSSVPKGTGAVAPDPIFGDGLAYLMACGVPERGARSFLGKMRGVTGDLVATELLAKAQQLEVSDPLPWLRKAAEKRTTTGRTASGVAL